MTNSALILDLDNTLYSWMDSYAPALQATITYLAKELRLPVPTIKESFKRVFQSHKSVEVVNSVIELDIWRNTVVCEEKKNEVQSNAQSLFFEVFKNNLHLFPDVERVLLWAKEKGIMLIAFSDARAYWADFRLSALNLYQYFDSIFVLMDEALPNTVLKPYPSSVIQYSTKQRKPNPELLLEILHASGVFSKQVYVIGDSKRKDILPASKLGLPSVWAKYGANYSSSSKRLVGAVTPWSASQRAGGGNIKPHYTIDSFSDIINILEENMKEVEECSSTWV